MGLREDIMTETVGTLPLREVLTVPPNTAITDAVELMRGKQLGCVYVIDEHQRPIGQFTERQVLEMLCDGVPLNRPIDQHMFPIPDNGYVKRSDPIVRVLQGMKETRLRFVCVVDDQGRVVGLTGQKGIMEYITEHFPHQIKAQGMDTNLHMKSREGA